MSQISERIKQLRIYNHFNQEHLARTCGIPLKHLIDLEEGTIQPSLEDAQDLSQFLGVDASYLLGKEEAYYIGYVHVENRVDEGKQKEADVWEKVFIRSDIEIYKYKVTMDEKGLLLFYQEQQLKYQTKTFQDTILDITRRIKKGDYPIEY